MNARTVQALGDLVIFQKPTVVAIGAATGMSRWNGDRINGL